MNTLRLLNLSSNLLQEIKWFTFNGLVKLTRLNLKANRIHWIEFKSFKTNIKLEYLNLDDNQIIESNKDIEQLKISMKLKLEVITKWLKDSGLVVNE